MGGGAVERASGGVTSETAGVLPGVLRARTRSNQHRLACDVCAVFGRAVFRLVFIEWRVRCAPTRHTESFPTCVTAASCHIRHAAHSLTITHHVGQLVTFRRSRNMRCDMDIRALCVQCGSTLSLVNGNTRLDLDARAARGKSSRPGPAGAACWQLGAGERVGNLDPWRPCGLSCSKETTW